MWVVRKVGTEFPTLGKEGLGVVPKKMQTKSPISTIPRAFCSNQIISIQALLSVYTL